MMEIKYFDLAKISESFEPELSNTILRVTRSGWYILGREVGIFENNFAKFCGASHCIGVGNGLDALRVILMSYKQQYDWENDDEVIVPAFTFIASVESIVQSRLKPVFCDVSEDDCLIDTKKLESLISPKTRAIVCVHLYGRVCDISSIAKLSKKYNLKIIEDAAQAHGAVSQDNILAGNMGDAAAFSFYPTKNLGALGDAGAIVTNDDELAVIARKIANYGQERKYYHQYKGINSRLDEIQAAILNMKLNRLDEDNMKRRMIAEYYFENIRNPFVRLPYNSFFSKHSVYHVFPVFSEKRDLLQEYLASQGIETIIHYPILPNKQEAFEECNNLSFPIAEQICKQELSIPLHPLLTNDEIHYIVDTINHFVC